LREKTGKFGYFIADFPLPMPAMSLNAGKILKGSADRRSLVAFTAIQKYE